MEIGCLAPPFQAPAVVNKEITQVSLSQYRGKWVVLLFYPKDFTFVCPTELIAFSDRHNEFEAVNAQVLALSTDTEECHLAWNRMPRAQVTRPRPAKGKGKRKKRRKLKKKKEKKN